MITQHNQGLIQDYSAHGLTQSIALAGFPVQTVVAIHSFKFIIRSVEPKYNIQMNNTPSINNRKSNILPLLFCYLYLNSIQDREYCNIILLVLRRIS